jgi:Asp-tRNA(Asn)/Glu-tRNA(Gln) amidotransferase A subunit family amidase
MPHRLALEQMADEIRRNRLACRELVEAHLRQIERHNPKLNAFVEIFAEEARAAARAADDATAVARLRQAGAILLGKTNCPEFLANYETDNHITGRTNNPWDLARTSGGSSGGEAALIAARCSAGGLGSDGGGSIRIPAHFCGIAGLKPTPGRVSAAGHFPLINHPGGLLGVGGPMARTAADVRLLFEETAGYDPDDPFSAPVPLRRPNLAGLRIGLLEQLHGVPVQAAVRSAVQQIAVLLERLGFPLEPFQPRGLERALDRPSGGHDTGNLRQFAGAACPGYPRQPQRRRHSGGRSTHRPPVRRGTAAGSGGADRRDPRAVFRAARIARLVLPVTQRRGG